jgi:hypothetical protein
MLSWKANFQIPNSGYQSEYVFLYAELNADTIDLQFYSDIEKCNLMWAESIKYIPSSEIDVYDYVLLQEKYKNYKKII